MSFCVANQPYTRHTHTQQKNERESERAREKNVTILNLQQPSISPLGFVFVTRRETKIWINKRTQAHTQTLNEMGTHNIFGSFFFVIVFVFRCNFLKRFVFFLPFVSTQVFETFRKKTWFLFSFGCFASQHNPFTNTHTHSTHRPQTKRTLLGFIFSDQHEIGPHKIKFSKIKTKFYSKQTTKNNNNWMKSLTFSCA